MVTEMSKFLDWPLRHSNLPLYMSVQLNRLKDARGIRVLITERVHGAKGAVIGFYVPPDICMTPQERKNNLLYAIEDAKRAVEELFADCDKPDCPNCRGENVTVR